jgi:pyruvoyl-dependent arginine decarboxylase (PvlArgDC)
MSIEDEPRSERPKEAVTDEHIKKVHKVKLWEIAETQKISKERAVDSEQCLAIYNRNKTEFLRRYITMDET